MDVREKLEVIAHLGDHISYKDDIGICYDSELAKVIEDAYMELKNGVTVQDRLVTKQAVIDEKYRSIRCPSCNAVLGASSHYCWQCGQKVKHKLPQPPKGE